MEEPIINEKEKYNYIENKAQILKCPECKNHIPFISFILVEKKIDLIIKCTKCPRVNIMPINDYFLFLSQEEKPIAHSCHYHPNSEAQDYCGSCLKWLCQKCVEAHKKKMETLYHKITQSETEISTNEVQTTPESSSIIDSRASSNKAQKRIDTKEIMETLLKTIKDNEDITQVIIRSIDKEIEKLNQAKNRLIKLYKTNAKVNHQIAFILKCALSNYTTYEQHLTQEIRFNVVDNIAFNTVPDASLFYKKDHQHHWNNRLAQEYIIRIKDFSQPLITDRTNYKDIRCVIELEDKRYALGLDKGTIILYSTENQTTLEKHTGSVLSLLQLKNKNLCSGSRDKTILLWDIGGKKVLFSFNGHTDSIFTIIELHNDKIASGSNNGTILVWDIKKINDKQNCEIKEYTSHTDCVRVLLKLDNGEVASGSWDKTLIIWSVNWEKKGELKEHTSYINSLTQLSQERIASGSNDGRIIIWNFVNLTLERTIEPLIEGGIHSLYFLKESEILISGGYKALTLWNLSSESNKSIITSINTHSSAIKSITRNKENTLVTWCFKGMINMWNI